MVLSLLVIVSDQANITVLLTVWCLLCFGPQLVNSNEYQTTPRPSLDQLRQKAAVQCSYRYSNSIYNVSERQCRNCVLRWSGKVDQLTEEADKLVYRMTFDCRPMEQLRRLCRSSSLPERRSLQAYIDCDDCLARNGVKDVGTTFDEVPQVIQARRNCIRVGHKVTVLTSSFGGRVYKDFKYNYDYELLREAYREACEEHFSQQAASMCNACFDNLFLWADYSVDQASKKLRSCLPSLSYKEVMARRCRLLNHPIYKNVFVPVNFEQCRKCFENSSIQESSSREQQLTVSYDCLPPANPLEELQLELCSKIDKVLPFWKEAPEKQPRNLCFEWASKQNLSAGIGYIQYKAAYQEIAEKIMSYLIATCSEEPQEVEKCKSCIQLTLSGIPSSFLRVTRKNFEAAFRCLLVNKNWDSLELDNAFTTVRSSDDSATGDSVVPNLNNGRQANYTRGPIIRIVSDA
ncbi:uncharacterized protein LOC111250883 isoform X3 [Varroa destructor]|uniref:Uncharacterized protein n=1 Tax=Varroa destructor TaxID=109461 RepID=A0A7M7K9R7_VARDE|nr:uncharacterized protein LOC111250883 isoform X3 [Varroa destructor]